MKIKEGISRYGQTLAGILLLGSPFGIGYYLWNILSPSTTFEMIASIVLMLIILIPEGILSWIIGLILIAD